MEHGISAVQVVRGNISVLKKEYQQITPVAFETLAVIFSIVLFSFSHCSQNTFHMKEFSTTVCQNSFLTKLKIQEGSPQIISLFFFRNAVYSLASVSFAGRMLLFTDYIQAGEAIIVNNEKLLALFH